MPEAQAGELEVWTARLADFGGTMPRDVDHLLDDIERQRAARFKHEADRRAYVLAHALRRSVLARWLAIDPREIRLSEAPAGRPVLLAPRDDTLHFSHSRSRDIVAFAVTRVAPVGIDVEAPRAGGIDEDMISRFVMLGDGPPLAHEQRASRLYFYWTALEAFWKAEGTGLADVNPRIECRQSASGQFDVWLEGDAQGPRARLFPIENSGGVCITLAICRTEEVRLQLFNGNTQLFNALPSHEMLSPR
jgi:phosphopantetheinyl transferase